MDWDELHNTFQTIYRQNRRFFLRSSFLIALSFAIACGMNFLLQGSILLLFFFTVIPFLECLCICNAEYHATGQYRMQTFYQGYRMSLLPGIHGSFRVLRAFFLALFTFLGCVFVILLSASFFTSIRDPLLLSLFEAKDFALSSFQHYWRSTTNHYRLLYLLTIVISFGVATMVFIKCSLNSAQLFYLQTTLLCSKKEAIHLYRQVSPFFKQEYRYFRYRFCGAFYYLFPFGYLLGMVLGISFSSHPFFVITLAIFLSSLICAPLLPYQALLQHHFFQCALPFYKLKGKPIFESMIKMIENNPSISEEQKQLAIMFYRQLLQEVDEMKRNEIFNKIDTSSSSDHKHD